MSDCVALLSNGSVLMGSYDGYGRLDGRDIFDNYDVEAYHKKCWEACGSPKKFTKASRNADDQGHFYIDEVHNSPPPGEVGFFKAK